jgi:hypothetical protein
MAALPNIPELNVNYLNTPAERQNGQMD